MRRAKKEKRRLATLIEDVVKAYALGLEEYSFTVPPTSVKKLSIKEIKDNHKELSNDVRR